MFVDANTFVAVFLKWFYSGTTTLLRLVKAANCLVDHLGRGKVGSKLEQMAIIVHLSPTKQETVRRMTLYKPKQ